MRISLFIPLFLLSCLPQTAWSQQRINLEEAIQISLENNFQLRQAENNLTLAEGEVTQAYAEFLPSLSASFGGNQNVGRQFIQEELTFEDRTTYGLSGGITANITLFNGFENINNLRRSRVRNRAEQASGDRIREDIIFNTAMRYLQLLLDTELLEIAKQNLETTQIQLEQVEVQVEVGTRPVVDLYQQESIVASNELQVVRAENAVNLSRSRLIRILQIDPLDEIEFVVPEIDQSDLIPQELNLEEMITYALTSRKDVEALEMDILASRYSLDIARSSHYPTITASAGLNTRYSDQYRIFDPVAETQVGVGFNDQFFDQMMTRRVGFNISIPIFSNWSTRTNIQQIEIQHRNAQLSLEDIQYEVREEVSQAYHDYQSLVKELEASERSLRAAERSYDTQQQRYEVGAASLIELNQATTDYIEALSNRQQVTYNFIFQEKLLNYYVGRIDEQISL